MTNLCGHDRDVLIWALTSTGRWPEFVAGLLEPSPGLPVYTQRVLREFLAPKREPTLRAIHDPAKLAEMLAEEGRRLSFDVEVCDEFEMFRGQKWPMLKFDDAEYAIRLVTRDMTTWRRILLTWLQLPNGAREEAERRLRGET